MRRGFCIIFYFIALFCTTCLMCIFAETCEMYCKCGVVYFKMLHVDTGDELILSPLSPPEEK